MSTRRKRPRGIDWLLIALAAAYFLTVAFGDFGSAPHATADAIGEGELWLLLSSGLTVAGTLHAPQIAIGAAVCGLVILREGARVWWLAALAGLVGSALVAYLAIAVAIALGSGSADAVAGQQDYGISTILAAGIGVLLVSGLLGLRGSWRDASPEDRAVTTAALVGAAAMVAISFGWYDVEHPIACGIGAGVARLAFGRSAVGDRR